MTTLYECVTVTLGYHKLRARWAPKMLSEEHKKKRMGFALDILTRYAETGGEFLNHIVTGDEMWDLGPSDFHLFLYLKRHLARQNFHDDAEIKNEVEMWFREQAVDFYDCGIQKLVTRLSKCLDNGGDFVEK
ncbi:hypothetical protein AVEN_32768-1 [Araneus ventricosus]|uniref:Histone-lysine N-methyltransferase SETMAR n=1 Tax=Araneus ventricosus TaxID=182803 RepID=A0A4Y2CUS6_ARAVE|nr:hypothetical protein AVEN_32768-1 [Araneus ventricosus]